MSSGKGVIDLASHRQAQGAGRRLTAFGFAHHLAIFERQDRLERLVVAGVYPGPRRCSRNSTRPDEYRTGTYVRASSTTWSGGPMRRTTSALPMPVLNIPKACVSTAVPPLDGALCGACGGAMPARVQVLACGIWTGGGTYELPGPGERMAGSPSPSHGAFWYLLPSLGIRTFVDIRAGQPWKAQGQRQCEGR